MATITTSKTDNNSVTLKKDSKGNYSWEIKLYYETDNDFVLNKLDDINTKLKNKYGSE